MDDEKKRQRDKMAGYLLFIAFISAFILLALFVKKCVPEDHYDEDYEEYLNEYYDGAERYDPV